MGWGGLTTLVICGGVILFKMALFLHQLIKNYFIRGVCASITEVPYFFNSNYINVCVAREVVLVGVTWVIAVCRFEVPPLRNVL